MGESEGYGGCVLSCQVCGFVLSVVKEVFCFSPGPTALHQKMGELDIHAVSCLDLLAKATETHTRKKIASLRHYITM